MTKPVVTLGNESGGEKAKATVANVSNHELELLDFDGRNGELNDTNVLFIGETGISRANLRTAKDAGETINGTEAVLIDGGADDLQATVFGTTTTIFNNTATNARWPAATSPRTAMTSCSAARATTPSTVAPATTASKAPPVPMRWTVARTSTRSRSWARHRAASMS